MQINLAHLTDDFKFPEGQDSKFTSDTVYQTNKRNPIKYKQVTPILQLWWKSLK